MRRTLLLTTVFVAVIAMTASAGINFTHGGIRAGYVAPKDIDNTIGFGGEIGFGVPVPNLSLSIEAGYWNKSYTDELTTWKLGFSDLSFGLSGKYEVDASQGKFYPYFGAGVGMHMLKAEIEVMGISASATDSKFGAHAFGGIRVPFAPVISGFVEARYTVVDPDYLGVYGGLNYSFAK